MSGYETFQLEFTFPYFYGTAFNIFKSLNHCHRRRRHNHHHHHGL
jgi:hypothetical protein